MKTKDVPISIPLLYLSLANKSNGGDGISSSTSSPINRTLISRSDFDDAYNSFQVLHIRGYVPKSTSLDKDRSFTAEDVQSLFASLNDKDKESWCIENKANQNGKTSSPDEFLDVKTKDQRGYCSFLVQHSTTVMEQLLEKRLPLIHLPVAETQHGTCDRKVPNKPDVADTAQMKVKYGPCLWLFFGKNYKTDNSNEKDTSATATPPLVGRPEHTDSITHDGTWHYQLSGTKIWRIRPTKELLNMIHDDDAVDTEQKKSTNKKRKLSESDDVQINANAGDEEEKDYIEVECKQGDILLINTRLWWHSTLIPTQDDVPCISYARDIYFVRSKNATTTMTAETSDKSEEGDDSNEEGDDSNKQSSMTNIDGTYAAEDIEASTVLFTEHTMPDCELHRSKTDPNCQLVELEDEATGEIYMAVVSLRDIKAGEFFCIAESDDDEEEENEEWGEEECDEE